MLGVVDSSHSSPSSSRGNSVEVGLEERVKGDGKVENGKGEENVKSRVRKKGEMARRSILRKREGD